MYLQTIRLAVILGYQRLFPCGIDAKDVPVRNIYHIQITLRIEGRAFDEAVYMLPSLVGVSPL
jgi:hypothetical protein